MAGLPGPSMLRLHEIRRAGVTAVSRSTGAIVAGAAPFEPADGWGGDHHDGVPIFIHSRHKPRIDISGWPLVTYVTDVAIAMADAKEAAGDKDASVHVAAVAQLAVGRRTRPARAPRRPAAARTGTPPLRPPRS
jgi:hypothetical protein